MSIDLNVAINPHKHLKMVDACWEKRGDHSALHPFLPVRVSRDVGTLLNIEAQLVQVIFDHKKYLTQATIAITLSNPAATAFEVFVLWKNTSPISSDMFAMRCISSTMLLSA